MKINQSAWGITYPKWRILEVSLESEEDAIRLATSAFYDVRLGKRTHMEMWDELQSKGYRCVRVQITAEVGL